MSKHDDLNVYTPTWQRAMRSLSRDGYWTKNLDLDDRELLRSYCGRADDHEFDSETWATPSSDLLDDDAQYDDALTVTRAQKKPYRGGKSIQEEQEQAERQRIYYARLAAKRRKIVEKRQEQIDQLRRAYIESADAAEKRMLKTMLADVEWDARQPDPEEEPEQYTGERSHKITAALIKAAAERSKHIDRSKTGRHYVPQWRLDEIEAELEKRRAAEAEREQAQAEEQRQRAREEQERMRARQEEELAKQRLIQAKRAEHRKAREDERAQAIQEERERWLEEHRRTMQPLQAKAEEYQRTHNPALHAAECERIKYAVLASIRGTGRMWTVEELMQAARCNDRNLLMKCCNELVGGGYIRPTMGTQL